MKRKHDRPTDEQIMEYANVPVAVAAAYLGKANDTLKHKLQDAATGVRPPVVYGDATMDRKTGKWNYSISPGLLVGYQRGTLNFVYPTGEAWDEILEMLCKSCINKLKAEEAAAKAAQDKAATA